MENVLLFLEWAIKRFMSIIIITIGLNEILNVYIEQSKNWEKRKLTFRLICFIGLGYICNQIYDTKEWIEIKGFWEVFAMAMVCVVFFFPLRAALKPFMSKILSKFISK